MLSQITKKNYSKHLTFEFSGKRCEQCKKTTERICFYSDKYNVDINKGRKQGDR